MRPPGGGARSKRARGHLLRAAASPRDCCRDKPHSSLPGPPSAARNRALSPRAYVAAPHLEHDRSQLLRCGRMARAGGVARIARHAAQSGRAAPAPVPGPRASAVHHLSCTYHRCISARKRFPFKPGATRSASTTPPCFPPVRSDARIPAAAARVRMRAAASVARALTSTRRASLSPPSPLRTRARGPLDAIDIARARRCGRRGFARPRGTHRQRACARRGSTCSHAGGRCV